MKTNHISEIGGWYIQWECIQQTARRVSKETQSKLYTCIYDEKRDQAIMCGIYNVQTISDCSHY